MKKTQNYLSLIAKSLTKNSKFFIVIPSFLLAVVLISSNFAAAQETSDSAKKLEKLELDSIKQEQQKITLRLKAMGKDKEPIMDLKQDDFNIEIRDTKNNTILFPDANETFSDINFRWKSPQDTVPDDAYIVVLFDMSGSMKCSTDLTTSDCKDIPIGERKFDAAIAILKQFIEDAKQWRGKTQVSIVPFGYNTDKGNCGFDESFVTITEDKIKNFATVADTNLDELAEKTPCTATNIYESLDKTVDVLTNTNDELFYPRDNNGELSINQPRLSIILFTDGFDTQYFNQNELIARNKQQQQLDKIRNKLTNKPKLSIYSLGYGLTPEQLGDIRGLGRPVNWNTDIDWDNNNSKPISREEYLDEISLEKIGNLTTLGKSKTADETEEISEVLELFLSSILGEYEIVYNHPEPQTGRGYEVRSFVNNIQSNEKMYKFSFVEITSPPHIFIGAIVVGLLFVGGWFAVYLKWKQKLEG